MCTDMSRQHHAHHDGRGSHVNIKTDNHASCTGVGACLGECPSSPLGDVSPQDRYPMVSSLK